MSANGQPRTSNRRTHWLVATISVAVVGLVMPFEASRTAATEPPPPVILAVDTQADDPSKSACLDATPSDCSLRGALINANADGNAEIERIDLQEGTFNLTVAGDGNEAGSLNVTSSVAIVGAGPGQTIIDANGLDRVLVVNGGGAVSDRNLVASGITFRGGAPCNEPGGNDDSGNTAGGGLMIHGLATLTDVVIEHNATCSVGGGLWVTQYGSAATLERAVVRNNSAGAGGGGIMSASSLTLTDSTVTGNAAAWRGGGLSLAGTAVISGSTISNNIAVGLGGGITTGDDTTSACCAATVSITNSTISGNLAGYYNSGTPQYFPGSGGGIHIGRSAFTLRHVTVTANISQTNPVSGAQGPAGGISTGYTNFLTLENSIVAGNAATSECALAETTYTTNGSLGCTTGGLTAVALGPLASNGGRTQTHAIVEGSTALGAGLPVLCTPFDQRGEPRANGETCDAGAYELQLAAPEPTPAPTVTPTQTPLPTPEPPPGTDPTAAPTAVPSPPTLETPMPSAPPDPEAVTITVDDAAATEGNAGLSQMTFTVRLSRPSATSVFVTASTSSATAGAPGDYLQISPTELAFEPGETLKAVHVSIVGDRVQEQPETFVLALSNPFGATLARSAATGTISEPAFGPFNATAAGNDYANAYLLGVLSHYVYEDTATAGMPASTTFQAAFRARFDRPADGIEVTGFVSSALTGTDGAFVETDDALIVVLRGTEPEVFGADAMDAFTDASINQVGGVHAGFAAAASSIYGSVSMRAAAARAEGKRVWLTGHSLGGGVATVLRFLLQASGTEVQGTYTYGAPRAYSATAAVVYNATFAARPTVRWIDDLDPVPHLPPAVILDYVHVGIVNNIVPGGPGATSCVVQLSSTERLVGGNLDDHDTRRYLARIYANLPSETLRGLVADPPAAPDAPAMVAGCNLAPATPASFARDAFLAGKDVLATAKGLAWDYGITGATALVQALLAAGYDVKQATRALASVLRSTADQAIVVLKGLSVDLKTIVVAVKEAFVLTTKSLAKKLLQAGYTSALELAIALRDGLNAKIDAVAEALRFAGYVGRDVVAALKTAFLAEAQIVINNMVLWGFPVEEMAIGLQVAYGMGATAIATIMRVAGLPANDVGTVLRSLYGFGAELVVATLKGAGYFATNIAEHLRSGFGMVATEAALVLKNAGFKATAVMTALRDVWSRSAESATNTLQLIKFTATEVMTALRDVYLQSAEAAAATMRAAGYSATLVLTALRDVFLKTATTGAAVLADAAYSASQVMTALKGVFNTAAGSAAGILENLGYTALDTAAALKSVYARTAAQAADLLQAAGYSATAIAGSLLGAYQSTAAQVTSLLKGEGFSVTAVTTAVKTTYSRTAAQMVTLLKGAGYSVTSVATGIKEAFGRSAAQVIDLLRDAAYSVTDVAVALKGAFAKTATEVASLLWSASYGIDQIITALRSAFSLTLSAALSILRSLGLII